MDPKIVQQSVLYEGWGRYLRLKVALPDGVVVERQLDHHGDAAAVLPYDPQRRTCILVRLWRIGPLFQGEPPHLVEAAAGMIDPHETPQACARREALEETGLELRTLEPVARVWASPSVSSERLHLYLAPYGLADRVGEGGGLAGEHEGIEVVERPLQELWAKVLAGEVDDMKTLVLAYALQQRRPDLF